MAGDEEDLGLGLAEAVAVADLDLEARDAGAVAPGPDDGAAGGLLDLHVAADMVTVMVGVQDVADLRAAFFGLAQHRAGHGGIDHADRPALRLADQPNIVVAQDRNANDFKGCAQACDPNKAPVQAPMAATVAEAARFLLTYQYVDGCPRSQ